MSSRNGSSIDCGSCRSLFRLFFPHAAVAVSCKLVPIYLRESTCPPALARAGEWLSLTSLGHSTARAATVMVHLRPVPPPVARGRKGYAPVPARRAVQPHRPLSWFQLFQIPPLHRQRREAVRPLGLSRKHQNEQATHSPRTCYLCWRDWRVPAALNCMARSRRQGSPPRFVCLRVAVPPLTALPSPRNGLLGRHARNLHSVSEGSCG